MRTCHFFLRLALPALCRSTVTLFGAEKVASFYHFLRIGSPCPRGPQIRALNIMWTHVDREPYTERILQVLRNCTHLKQLLVYYPPLYSNPLVWLTITEATALEELLVCLENIETAHLCKLANLPLRTLSLEAHNSTIENAALHALAPLASNLVELKLICDLPPCISTRAAFPRVKRLALLASMTHSNPFKGGLARAFPSVTHFILRGGFWGKPKADDHLLREESSRAWVENRNSKAWPSLAAFTADDPVVAFVMAVPRHLSLLSVPWWGDTPLVLPTIMADTTPRILELTSIVFPTDIREEMFSVLSRIADSPAAAASLRTLIIRSDFLAFVGEQCDTAQQLMRSLRDALGKLPITHLLLAFIGLSQKLTGKDPPGLSAFADLCAECFSTGSTSLCWIGVVTNGDEVPLRSWKLVRKLAPGPSAQGEGFDNVMSPPALCQETQYQGWASLLSAGMEIAIADVDHFRDFLRVAKQ
ncbi:hypothetical protein L227DRAFT_606705 [Lentinus tigrinus ALCF2SS1-6]|uniref:F-box domain-containing protein n=2 Tax=Lentinus tigrinus TaxID=5365 RepID=A0A5C2SS03_9APHY|nr:hypothetical protein L227DRAFT_606705 [Lentinus tigrinus ALCF2SS1-6]